MRFSEALGAGIEYVLNSCYSTEPSTPLESFTQAGLTVWRNSLLYTFNTPLDVARQTAASISHTSSREQATLRNNPRSWQYDTKEPSRRRARLSLLR